MMFMEGFPVQFLNPWALGFLALVPLLILLYFLKLKRPQVRIASTLLWQKVIEDVRVNSPFQRLKRSLLLLLQLILLLLLVFALARPWIRAISEKEESLVVILDTSASMQALEPDARTRLDHAKAEITKWIDGMSRRSEMAILSFDHRSRTLSPFSSNQNSLRKALQQVKASDGRTEPVNALRKAQSLAASRKNSRVLLFSDGSFQDPGKVNVPVEFHLIGTTLPNVAITGMDVQRMAHDPEQVELFVAVHNFGDAAIKTSMAIYLNDQLLDSKPLALNGNSGSSDVFSGRMTGGGVLRVLIDVDDPLPLDNQASLIVPLLRPKNVLLVGDNTLYHEKALASAPDVNIISCSIQEYPKYANEKFHTVVWINVEQPQVAPGNNIYFGCLPPAFELDSKGMIKAPYIAAWNTRHPIARFIDFSNLVIAETIHLVLPADADVILESSETPIIGAFERDRRFLVVCGFDVFKSSWPFQVSFVLFLHNCLNFFDASQSIAGNLNVRVGDSVMVPEQERMPVIRTPDGKRENMMHAAGSGYSFGRVDSAGIYTIEKMNDVEKHRFAANLLSQAESHLVTVSNPISEDGKSRVTPATSGVTREYIRTLLSLALILLLAEWIVYHRRILN